MNIFPLADTMIILYAHNSEGEATRLKIVQNTTLLEAAYHVNYHIPHIAHHTNHIHTALVVLLETTERLPRTL